MAMNFRQGRRVPHDHLDDWGVLRFRVESLCPNPNPMVMDLHQLYGFRGGMVEIHFYA
jgi:hypothetical protein